MARYRLQIEFSVQDDDAARTVTDAAQRALTTRGLRVGIHSTLLRETVKPWVRYAAVSQDVRKAGTIS